MSHRNFSSPASASRGNAIPLQGEFFLSKREALAFLRLSDRSVWAGVSCAAHASVSGEVVFNTGMVGYVEALTDPSYAGQILVLTYPLIGNYGVPSRAEWESKKIQVRAVVMAHCAGVWSHWQGKISFASWLASQGIPCLSGVDTRALTLRLREHGVMPGAIEQKGETCALDDPNKTNMVATVSPRTVRVAGTGRKRVILVDCGAKENILRSLLARGLTVIRVPYDYNYTRVRAAGIVISNGPGDPVQCRATIAVLRKAYYQRRPLFGICLGSQLMGIAAGASTYKLPYGHRGQNQPCVIEGSERCLLTSQNHGYAVRERTLMRDWRVSFRNANDGTVEGIAHTTLPFFSVQFHPEAHPGPQDSDYLFDEFAKLL